MDRRLFLAATAASCAGIAAPAFAQSADEAQALVRQISDDILAVMRSSTDLRAQSAQFVAMLDRHADTRQIAGFALGRYGRSMPEALKTRYVQAFRNFISAIYVNQFAGYSGETIDVGNARPTSNGYSVDTRVLRGSQPPIDVRWQLSNRSGRMMVEDFVVEGISMASSQRSEFTSLIDSYGGDLEKFVQFLESRG